MEKTESLLSLELLGMLNQPCSLTHWREAVVENPNYMQDDYDHLIKYSAIPEDVLKEYFEELQKALKPLDDDLWTGSPSKGIIYMVQNPEYRKEWEERMAKREVIRKSQEQARLAIEKKMYNKYLKEYGIKFIQQYGI